MYDKYLKEMDNRKLYIEKEVNKLDDDFNIIFKYEVKNAFGMVDKGLFVTTDSGNNTYLYSKYSCEKELLVDVTKIVDILNKYADTLPKEEDLPMSNILDGFINEISFKINNKWYNFKYFNLVYYEPELIDSDKNLNIVFNFLNELYDYFESIDKDINNYFVLDLE